MTGDYVDSNPLANITIAGVPESVKLTPLSIAGTDCSQSDIKVTRENTTVYVTGLESVTGQGAWAGGMVVSIWS